MMVVVAEEEDDEAANQDVAAGLPREACRGVPSSIF